MYMRNRQTVLAWVWVADLQESKSPKEAACKKLTAVDIIYGHRCDLQTGNGSVTCCDAALIYQRGL